MRSPLRRGKRGAALALAVAALALALSASAVCLERGHGPEAALPGAR
jgi:hypothetical protein